MKSLDLLISDHNIFYLFLGSKLTVEWSSVHLHIRNTTGKILATKHMLEMYFQSKGLGKFIYI